MGFLWPGRPSSSTTTVLVRLGRLLHWIAIALAAATWAGALLVLVFTRDAAGYIVLAALMLLGALLFLGGRGLRYVLSNE